VPSAEYMVLPCCHPSLLFITMSTRPGYQPPTNMAQLIVITAAEMH